MRKMMMVIVLVLGSLPLVACGAGRVEIVRERGSDVFNVTVELNEDDMAQLVETALSNRNPLLRDPVVDLQDGQVVVAGTHERRDGNGEVDGRIVIAPTVQDGHLVLTVTEISIDGVDVDDARIQQFNDNLAERIERRLDNRTRELTMTAVSVTDDLLVLMFDAERLDS